MYDQEFKNKILHLLKQKTVKEVAQEFNISSTTLYRWSKAKEDSKLIKKFIGIKNYVEAIELAKKHPNDTLIQSQLVTIYIKRKEYEKVEEIAKKYPSHTPIQSQLITIYMNQKKYDKAEEIAEKYPNYVPIQSQLITIYIKKEEYDKAEEIAKKYPNDILIQSQLVTIYIKREKYDKAEEIANKYPNYAPIQSQLMTINNKKEIEKAKETLEDAIIQNKNQDFPKEVGEIRNKISKGTISVKDLENLENFKQQIGLGNYLLIMMAVYEKLGLSNMCKRLLKQDKILDVKLKSQLMTYFEQKNKIYNLEKWDNLIGWFNEQENFIDEVAEKNIEVLEAKETDLPVKKQHLELKVKNSNISEKMVIVTPSKVGEVSEKKNIKDKVKVKVKTLKDILNKPSKEMILDLKIKYYKEMHDLEKRESAIYKYDRLEEILSSEPSIKNFDSLLLMLIGDGNDKEKVEQSIPEQYSGEYKKVLNRINSRKKH